MDIVDSLAIFEKQIDVTSLSKNDKDKVLSCAIRVFSHAMEVENENLENMIKRYSGEIFQVVKDRSDHPETCKEYIEFAIKNILYRSK